MGKLKCLRPQISFDSYEGEVATSSPWVTDPKNTGNRAEGVCVEFSQI